MLSSNKNRVLFISFLIALASYSWAQSETRPRESNRTILGIDRVFVPNGFDDNDFAELVVDVVFPSLCYELESPQVTIDLIAKEIFIEQPAYKRGIALCREHSMATPRPGSWVLPFSQVAKLGRLDAGTYRVKYMSSFGNYETTKLKVNKANSDSIDDVLYAPILSAFVPDMVFENDQVSLILSDILPSNCMNLEQDKVVVLRHGNMVEVLPELTIYSDRTCSSRQVPLQVMVPLGEFESKGRYNVHIRRTTGQSLNKTFTVASKTHDPSSGHP